MKKLIVSLLMLLVLAAISFASPYKVELRDTIVNPDSFASALDQLPNTVTVGLASDINEPSYEGAFDWQGNALWEYLIVPTDKVSDALALYNSVNKADIVFKDGYTPYLILNDFGQVWSSGQYVRMR